MLKKLLNPLLVLIALGAGGFYYTSGQAAQPLHQGAAPATPSAQPAGLVAPLQQVPSPSPALPRPKQPDVDVMLIIDNSGSMFGLSCNPDTGEYGRPIPANDAENKRITGAQIVISALAADLKPRETKLGIVSFGSKAELVSPLTQLSNDDPSVRAQLAAAIQDPSCKGDTDIVAAVRLAQQELRSERHNPANIPAIIFLTDGVPTLTAGVASDEASARGAISGLLDELENVRFFAILLGKDPSFEKFKGFWREQEGTHANVKVYELTSSVGIPEIYHQITAQLDNRDNAPLDRPTLPPGSSVSIEIPPNVQQAIFTIIKPAAHTQVALARPDRQDAALLPPDRFHSFASSTLVDVFILQRPDPGTWVVSAPGGETLTALQPELKSIYEVQVVQPDAQGVLGVDRPTDLVAQVIDSQVRTPLSGTFTLEGSYRLKDAPAGDAQKLVLGPAPTPGQYAVQFPAGTFGDASVYLFSIEARDGLGLRSDVFDYEFSAGRIPDIVSVAARSQVFVDEQTPIEVKVANADSVSGSSSPHLLQTLPGGAAPAFTARDPTTFQATLPAFGRPGSYPLTIVYAGKTTTQRNFNASRTITIVVAERPLTILLRSLSLAVAALLGLYLLFRYVLLSPLIPALQRIGLAPQGYIRITTPDAGTPDPEISLASILRRRRKLRKLTIGPEGDIPLQQVSAAPDDDEAAPRRLSMRERLWGKRSLGLIGRQLRGTTFIQRENGAPSDFTNSSKQIQIAGHQIDYSLKSSADADEDAIWS